MQSTSQRVSAPPSSYSPTVAARQYSQPSPQNRDVYQPNQSPQQSSHLPQSSRRQSSNAPTSQSHPSPPAADAYVSAQGYPASRTANHQQSTGSDQYDGQPVPPPRSSSHLPSSPAPLDSRVATSRQSRQSPYDSRTHQGRSHAQGEPVSGPPRNAAPTGHMPAADASSSRSRRHGPASPDTTHGTRSPRGPPHRAHVAGQLHPDAELAAAAAAAAAASGRPNPPVDVAREEDRIAEARPARSDPASAMDVNPVRSGAGDDVDGRRRQDYSKNSSRRKDVQFGEYMLGQTLGEGEFGKVKLGWKKDGSVQVAIKLIRRESVATNPSRLPKIYREIAILSELSHPNIVRLHDRFDTDSHIGIILEYASGGELFDYILNHRYLKDPAARRLFAQLVSGVGYLHKKGIVHRDLKLENLLLDRNRNIIITDFGFANTFNPADELSDDLVYNLANRDFVKKYQLDRPDGSGMRKGDLMQTSCGSPCYAAPELVVSDSLYTGRKVDVWSCGVILYAMLAGYLPFDDDPANPEGDNINLLYKYITTTALTFPEYVTPHARDLLRRILVPDPRKRADLFEVARHSWLSEYHHVVSHITSSTTNIADIANSTVPSDEPGSVPGLARSASVREPAKVPTQTATSPIGGLSHHPAKLPQEDEAEQPARRRNVNRHTIQPEYVQPQSHTARGEPATTAPGPTASTPVRSGSQGPASAAARSASRSKPLPKEPSEATKVADYPNVSSADNQPRMQPPTRPARDVPRSVSDSTSAFGAGPTPPTMAAHPDVTRPSTGNTASGFGRADPRLPSRGSYGQPVAPTVEAANAHGRVTRPKNARGYNISGPIPQHNPGQSISRVPVPVRNPEPPPQHAQEAATKAHHRRSSTLSGLGERLFGRTASVKAGKQTVDGSRPKKDKRYPPTSMKDSYASSNAPSRTSIDSKRSFSFGLGKKKSVDLESQRQPEEKPKRFSALLPSTFSFPGFGGGGGSKDVDSDPESPAPQAGDFPRPPSGVASGRPSTQPHRTSTGPGKRQYSDQSQFRGQPQLGQDGPSDQARPAQTNFSRPPQYQPAPSRIPNVRSGSTGGNAPDQSNPPPQSYRQQQSYSQQSPQYVNSSADQARPPYPDGFDSQGSSARQSMQQASQGRGGLLQKQNRNFNNAYDYEQGPNRHEGSSGPARKVMDYFRRRKARADSYQ